MKIEDSAAGRGATPQQKSNSEGRISNASHLTGNVVLVENMVEYAQKRERERRMCAKKKQNNQMELTLEPEMANAQDLYNFVSKACDYLRGPVGHESFKDYLTPILYYKLYADFADVEDYARVVTREEIAEKGYDLSVNKYVKYHEEAVKSYSEVKAEFEIASKDITDATRRFRQLLKQRGVLR